MKMCMRTTALCLLLILCATACAEVPQLSDDLFSSAKQALTFLASGEYERLVTLLPFSGVAPSAAEWQSFAEGNFTSLSNGVQTDYAVAYWNGSTWKIAVPVAAPDSGKVETLVLTSSDGSNFSGYRYSNWSGVQEEYEGASYVTWNQEYVSDEPMVAVD